MKTIKLHSAKRLAQSAKKEEPGVKSLVSSLALRATQYWLSAMHKISGIKKITSYLMISTLCVMPYALRAMRLFTQNPFTRKHPTHLLSCAMRYVLSAERLLTPKISRPTNPTQLCSCAMPYALSATRFVLSAVLLTLASCSSDDPAPEPYQPTPYEIDIPYGFPTLLNIPEDNPMTVEGVELGRTLFYDGRLNGRTHPDSLMSCSTCHRQENSFEAGTKYPHGVTGKPTHHTMLPMINLVWNMGEYGWNGSISSIEADVLGVISDPSEFDSSPEKVVSTIQNIEGYPEMFRKAFGDNEVTVDRIAKAIAQFVRTLISSNSKFDKYMRGEVQLSPEELRGFVLFTTEEGADCFHCHGGYGNPLFTTNKFYNNGKDSIFTDPSDRYAISGDPMDKGAYKATTLRNIELTGPYMHDGRFTTLEEVIEFYSHDLINTPQIDPLMHHIANGGIQLTPPEKADLMAFIKTLRDDEFLSNPDFGPPEIDVKANR